MQQYSSGRAVALLGNVQLGHHWERAVVVVLRLAVEEGDHVCVLLDGAGLAERANTRRHSIYGTLTYDAFRSNKKRTHQTSCPVSQTLGGSSDMSPTGPAR